jgi:hypothetical protein
MLKVIADCRSNAEKLSAFVATTQHYNHVMRCNAKELRDIKVLREAQRIMADRVDNNAQDLADMIAILEDLVVTDLNIRGM